MTTILLLMAGLFWFIGAALVLVLCAAAHRMPPITEDKHVQQAGPSADHNCELKHQAA
jgi:hypothetical protein